MAPSRSFGQRLWAVLRKEKTLARLGPFYLVRSPLPHILLGCLLACGIFWMIFSIGGAWNGTQEALGIWNAPGFLLCCAVLIALLFSFRLKLSGKTGFFFSTLIFALAPFAAYYMVEMLNGMAAYDRKPGIVLMNLVSYALVYLLFLVIFGNYRWAVFFGTGLFYVFGVACYFVLLFRGTPLVPLDLMSSGTAAGVMSNYVFELSPHWTVATVQCGLIMGIGFQLGRSNLRRIRWKLTLRTLAAMIVLGLVGTFFSQSHLEENGYAISYWNQQESYEQFGNWTAFCINVRNVYPERPVDYDAAKVREIVDKTMEDSGIDPEGSEAYNLLTGSDDYTASEQQPNIVLIMNESFADLQSMGKGFETNTEVMPFFKSLKENTIRGTLQVSIQGGGTACTEYEVLTGNAQHFLPNGAVAYSANIHSATPSLAWTLRDQGYATGAFHPYAGENWNRTRAYGYLGFEDAVFLEDILPEDVCAMSAEDRMAAVEALDPDDGNVYNRDYMSDHYDFKILEDLFEEKSADQPCFLFNVTIQNHGGYAEDCENFRGNVEITDLDGDYPQAEQYLSLIRETDKAFEELIDYFKDVDEPTLVIMYGDHIPSVEAAFYEALYDGKSINDLSTAELQERFQTPFVIWANYDIPEKDVGTISANYFSTLILETAGLQLPDYNRYLASLYESVPVVSSVGYKNADGDVVLHAEGTDLESLIDGYQCVAYNNLYDYSHRDWSIFTLDGESLDDALGASE